ncbi:DUF2804 domain-containing protein [Microbacterium sp. KR10-403]|uniref:DUF2804 domain-containing protein n=1 Tax=Microbacterium sp. KR10-403 TaxID=3158581 RepID=UPI0032E4793F
MSDHEITTRVRLVHPNGRLDAASIGWTRHQLHDTDRIGHGWYGWGRNKRWEYWAVITPTHIIGLTIAALDFATVRQLWVLERATMTEIDRFEISPLSRGVSMTGTHGTGVNESHGRGLWLRFEDGDAGTRLQARTDRVQVDLTAEIPPGHEAMGLASPHSRRLVDYTVKDVDRPVTGTITVDGVVHDATGFAALDHARSRGPYRTDWNWGCAIGRDAAGRRLGINLGGSGPEGLRNGISHTGLTVDGRVHKIPTALRWEFDPSDWSAPWHLSNERVDLTFTPFFHRYAHTNFVVIRSTTNHCFGTFAGRVQADDGEWIDLTGLEGWAEDVHNRW